MDQPFGIAPSGYRLPAGTRVGAVRLLVSDIDRSVRFYENVLGFRVLARAANSATLGAHGDGAPVVHLETAPGLTHSSGGALGLYHFAIVLPDRAALGRFAAHLSAIHARAGMADHLVSEALYFSDPDGLGIEVYADRPRAEWRQERRELVMTTEPLDVRSLLAAAGEQPWQGMPAGTRIGHIHLHVGNLRQAEGFYHAALGFDKVVWSYPGALFFSAGGYHHHLGTNTWGSGEKPADDEGRLLQWELVLPGKDDASAAAKSLEEGGYAAEEGEEGWRTADPWGTVVILRASALEN